MRTQTRDAMASHKAEVGRIAKPTTERAPAGAREAYRAAAGLRCL